MRETLTYDITHQNFDIVYIHVVRRNFFFFFFFFLFLLECLIT